MIIHLNLSHKMATQTTSDLLYPFDDFIQSSVYIIYIYLSERALEQPPCASQSARDAPACGGAAAA